MYGTRGVTAVKEMGGKSASCQHALTARCFYLLQHMPHFMRFSVFRSCSPPLCWRLDDVDPVLFQESSSLWHIVILKNFEWAIGEVDGWLGGF